MIINIKNWGVVSSIKIDISRSLIILCGPNSTGKTYVSYLVYSLFSKITRELDYNSSVSLPSEVLDEIVKKGEFELNEQIIQHLCNEFCKYIKKKIVPLIFAINPEESKILFKNFKLSIELTDSDISSVMKSGIYLDEFNFRNLLLNIHKDTKSQKISIAVSHKDNNNKDIISESTVSEISNRLISKLLLRFIFKLSDSRMLTVERNSIYTFSKELSLVRSEFDPFSFGKLQRYPLAVTESLRIAEDLQMVKKNKGFFHEYAMQLEENLLKGNIEINENGAIEFIPHQLKDNSPRLPIYMTSSIVKTMASLIVFLKHIGHQNDLLIIDEPEMNLHPDSQIILTRIFAELVNKGLKLIISTHSDYIIREFNNMIMANEIVKGKYKLEENESIPYEKSQLIPVENTEVFYFNFNNKTGKVTAKSVEVTKLGFDIESIDETIESQTEITNFLADILKYGVCEQ